MTLQRFDLQTSLTNGPGLPVTLEVRYDRDDEEDMVQIVRTCETTQKTLYWDGTEIRELNKLLTEALEKLE